MKRIILSKEQLYKLYIIKNLNMKIISKIFNCCSHTVKQNLRLYTIRIRNTKIKEDNPNFKDGRTLKKYYCKEVGCSNEISINCALYGQGRCASCAHKGERNPNFGNPLNMKEKNHPRYKDGKFTRKNYCADCGEEIHPYAKRCSTCKQLGKLNHKYIDGRSNEPYPLEFNNKLKLKIRKRDNFTCQKCEILEIKYYRKLDIHHIDYDKNDNKEDNLISLCNDCNNEVNENREYWKKYFQNKLEKEVNYGDEFNGKNKLC